MRVSSFGLRPIYSAALFFLLITIISLSGASQASAQVRRERPGARTQTGNLVESSTGGLVAERAPGSTDPDSTDASLRQAITNAGLVKSRDGETGDLFSGGRYEEATVTANDGNSGDALGFSVAISGNTAVVSRLYYFGKTVTEGSVGGSYNEEAVYVFVRSGSTWTQQAKLVASDATPFIAFGYSVAISGDTIAIGAPGADVGGSDNQGAVYIFVRSGDTWTEQAKLVAADGFSYDNLGYGVSLDGDTLAAGAPYADDNTGCAVWDGDVCANGVSLDNVGAAYVFVRSGTVWSQQQKLPNGSGMTSDEFGVDVAISGGTIVVGCPYCDISGKSEQGAAFVFVRSGSLWNQEAKISASDGAADDYFAFSVDADGDTALIGSPCASASSVDCSGAAYVFNRSVSTWSQGQKLLPASAQQEGYFGYTVGLSGDLAVAGSPGDNLGSPDFGRGSVEVFKRADSTWTRTDKFSDATSRYYDLFGFSADVSGDSVIVGVPLDDVAAPPMMAPKGAVPISNDQGSVRIFQTKIDITKESPIDGASSDWFGRSVAISGDTAVVGAPLADIGSNVNQGAAYVYVRSGSSWFPQAKLTAADGAAGDNFGWSVAIDGDTIVVGSPLDDNGTNADEGSSYVFTRSIGVWTQQQRLGSYQGAAGNNTGWSVAVSGSKILVGDPKADYTSSANGGPNTDSGRVTEWNRSGGGTWTIRYLVFWTGNSNVYWGWSVGLSGTLGVVGTPNLLEGKAYIVDYTGSSVVFSALVSPDGASGDNFGWSVSISGTTAVVGAPQHDLGVLSCPGASVGCLSEPIAPEATAANQGAVYVFAKSGGTWGLQQKVTASDNANNDRFGYGVSLSGNNLLVGAYGDDVGNNADQGSSYVFTRWGSRWSEQRKLNDETGGAGDGFGWAVGVSTSTAVVGAWADDVTPTPELNPNQGSASFYYWAQAVPTAAGSRLSGKVVAPDGRGLAGATVVLTDGTGKQRAVQTGTFGNFAFEDLPTGELLVVDVRLKGYQFSPQALEMLSDMDDLRIIASGGSRR